MFSSKLNLFYIKKITNKFNFYNFGTSSKRFRQIKSVKQIFENNFKGSNYEKASRTFKLVGAVSSAVGIGVISYYALKQTDDKFSIVDKAAVWPSYVRERIHSTYAFFALSNLVTAASAVSVFKNPMLFQLASRATIPATIIGLVCVVGSGIICRSIPYPRNGSIGLKHLAWLTHCGTIGFLISPVCLMGGYVVQKAALYTLGIVGGLSAVAVTAPSDKFLYMGGPLAMGLGLVLVSSIAGMFLNPMSQLGAATLSIQLYGGLALFGGFLLYDTQHVIKKAESHPPDQSSNYGESNGIPLFDPINNSMGIYLDTINIFIRLATIMGINNSKKR